MKEGNFLYTFKQPQEKKLKQTNKIRGMVSREFGFNSSIKVSVNMFATSEVLGKWKPM